MGLAKSITYPDGVVVNYHRIIEVCAIVDNQRTISVASYLTQTLRDSGAHPYATGHYRVAWKDWQAAWEAGTGPTPADDYAYLKTLEAFADAEDVIESTTTEATA